MNSFYLDAIKKFEGFVQRAEWDYAQHTNGYGTRARFPGEVIDRTEAERRFQIEIKEARTIVERNVPGADEGTKAALTSLTFNAGDKWTRSGLGEALRQGDAETARELFLQYNKAGGQILPGLVARRMAEAGWFGNPAAAAAADDVPVAAARSTAGETAGNLKVASLIDAAAVRSSIVPQAPEQRFAQEASALLVLMQLEKLPLLPNRSEVNDDRDRNEQRKSVQDATLVRT